MDGEFSAAEVSRLAGFKKPWMLGHLEREGIFIREHVSDRRHGKVRKYTFADLLILRSINRLLEVGARPARIKQVIHELGRLQAIRESRDAAISMARALDVRLFVSKDSAYLLENESEIIDLTRKGQLAFGFMIHVKSIAAEVVNVAEDYIGKKQGNLKIDISLLEGLCEAAGI